MEAAEMTNNKLAKFVSVEFILSLLIFAFTFGAGYTALAAESADTKTKVNRIDNRQRKLSATVNVIQTDIAVIKNDQQHVKRQLEENKQDLKRMLTILERRSSDD